MATLSSNEQELIRQAFVDAESGAESGAETESITGDGLKEAFCDSWPSVKEVLEFLKPFAGPAVGAAIGVVVRVGDKLHGGALCKPQVG